MSQSEPKEVFREFVVRREVWQIGGSRIDLTWPEDMDALLDSARTHERFARNEYMPYWAQPWPAGILLAEYILSREPGLGRSAVEIGCGLGLVSVAAALAGWRVIATDYDEDALAFAELNATRNGAKLAGTQLLDFVEQSPSAQYDCVFAADLLYERRLSEPVARWIAAALNPTGYALASDPNRSAAGEFPAALSNNGLTAQAEAVTTTAPAGLPTKGRVWRIRRQHASG